VRDFVSFIGVVQISEREEEEGASDEDSGQPETRGERRKREVKL